MDAIFLELLARDHKFYTTLQAEDSTGHYPKIGHTLPERAVVGKLESTRTRRELKLSVREIYGKQSLGSAETWARGKFSALFGGGGAPAVAAF